VPFAVELSGDLWECLLGSEDEEEWGKGEERKRGLKGGREWNRRDGGGKGKVCRGDGG